MLNVHCVFQLVNSINLPFIQQKFFEHPSNEKHICGIVAGLQFAAVLKLDEFRAHGQRDSLELKCNHGINSLE